MKNILYFALLVALVFGCKDSNDDSGFTGITRTDETGTIHKNDPDDWRPWQYIGTGSVPTGIANAIPAQISSDTVHIPDSSFILSCYPNPCTDHFSLYFSSPYSATFVFELYDKPGHLFKRFQAFHLVAGLHTISFDVPHWAEDMKTELFPDGIYRLYVKRYTANGSIYQTYGDIQIDRMGY